MSKIISNFLIFVGNFIYSKYTYINQKYSFFNFYFSSIPDVKICLKENVKKQQMLLGNCIQVKCFFPIPSYVLFLSKTDFVLIL